MDWLKDIALNKLVFLGFLLITILLICLWAIDFFIKKGNIESIKTKNGEIRIRSAKAETAYVTRELIRRDIESVEKYLKSFSYEIDKNREKLGFEKDLGSDYIIERLYDIAVKWIVFNQVSRNQAYVKAKRHELWNEFKLAVIYQSRSLKKEKDIEYLTSMWQSKIYSIADGIITICIDNKMLLMADE